MEVTQQKSPCWSMLRKQVGGEEVFKAELRKNQGASVSSNSSSVEFKFEF